MSACTTSIGLISYFKQNIIASGLVEKSRKQKNWLLARFFLMENIRAKKVNGKLNENVLNTNETRNFGKSINFLFFLKNLSINLPIKL